MILVLVCGRNHAGFWEGMCCLWRNWASRMAVWQGQASNIPVKGTASIVVKVLQQSSYCFFALNPFVKTLWAWVMSVYSSGYKALMNLSLYICWWVICRSVVGWLGFGYPQVSCQICGDGGHPTIDCPQKHSGTDLGQVCTFGEMCNFLPQYRDCVEFFSLCRVFKVNNWE